MIRTLFAVALIAAALLLAAPPVQAQSGGPVFEMRTYTTVEGRMPALLARFRDHATKLFEKHGIENVGYWVPTDAPRSQNTLVYILKHKSREAATASWAAFRADPAWQKAQKESEASGKIVDKAESVFLGATDFSKLK